MVDDTAAAAVAVPRLALARTVLHRTVHSADHVFDAVRKQFTVSTLRARKGTVTKLLDLKLRSLAAKLRVALGKMLLQKSRTGGWELYHGWSINVEVQDRHHRARGSELSEGSGSGGKDMPEEHHDESKDKEHDPAQEMVQVLSLRVYSKGSAPSFEKFGATFDDLDDDSSDEDEDSDDGGSESDEDVPAVDVSRLAKQHTFKNITAAARAPSLSPGGRTGPECPKDWAEERQDVVRVDLDVDLALQVNWRRFDVCFALQRPCCGSTGAAVRLGVLAIALRTPVVVWWHVGRNQAKLALVEQASELHFRSFAEVSVGCFQPRPDHAGVTSRIVRALLRKCTPEQPLNIDFPTQENPRCKLHWEGYSLSF